MRPAFVRAGLALCAVLAVGVWLLVSNDGHDARAGSPAPQAPEHASAEQPTGQSSKHRAVRFTVSASGDLLIQEPLYERALANGGGDSYDFDPFFKRIKPYIGGGVDLGLCHVETPLGPGPPSGYPVFNTPSALADTVGRSGWDACDTASNHSFDQGQPGIDGTVKALHRAGVRHTGSFASKRASHRPLIVRVEGVKVGIVAYTDSTNGLEAPHPWSANVYDLNDPAAGARQILHDVRAARRAGAEAVIVQLHWGHEYGSEPKPSQVAVAKRITKSKSVSVVVGQGAHLVQPIERMHGKYVVFSEGNLVSNQSAAAGLPAATQDGLIALLRFEARPGKRVRVKSVKYMPIWVRPGDYVVIPADSKSSGAIAASRKRTISVAGHGDAIKPVR
jgi:poly-gamma-glutamate synthesis protein (capsule biosynthesis protein)